MNKDDIELLERAYDYCEMVADEIKEENLDPFSIKGNLCLAMINIYSALKKIEKSIS